MEKQKRYGVKRKAPCCGSTGSVSLEDAKTGINKMKALKWDDLLVAGKVTCLPYPGIGYPPSRPGGAVDYVGMTYLKEVLELFKDLSAGKTLLVEGPRGIGKSCILRALAWILIMQANDFRKLLCIWAMGVSLRRGLLEVVKNGLRFTYCFEDSVLTEIESLGSMAEIVEFIRRRKLKGETFILIVDGAEYMDLTAAEKANSLARRELRKSVESLANEAFKCAYAMSLGASIVSSNEMMPSVKLLGFTNEEYVAYVSQVSVLNDVYSAFPSYADIIDYYGGQHPLSLAVLDYCLRKRAARKMPNQSDLDYWSPWELQPLDNQQTLELLPDDEDIQAALDMFLSSSEVEGIRASIASLLTKHRDRVASIYRQDEMIEVDASYVLEGGDYCTQFIKRMYIEEFRIADRVFGGAASWLPYCKYLLKDPAGVNWAEMGWLCEHLIGDALLMGGGLDLDGFYVQNVGSRVFTTVPRYTDGIFFIPLKYIYGYIDGLLVIRQGKLHLFAIQITVNASWHYQSAEKFMNLSVVEKWIPEILAEREEWELHFVFVCCESKDAVTVQPNLKVTRSGCVFGILGYTMHQVTFQSLLANSNLSGDLQTVLQDIATRRTPEEERNSAATGPAQATPAPGLLERILAYTDRKKLNQIAEGEGIACDPELRKAEIIQKLAEKLGKD